MYPHHNLKEEAKLRDRIACSQAKSKKGDREEKVLNMLNMSSDIQIYMANMKLVVLNLVRSLFT